MFKYILLLLIFFTATISVSWATNAVGHITKIQGNAMRVQDGTHEKLTRGTAIYLHDQITTEENSTVKITFIDQTELVLGAGADMSIDKYAYSPKEDSENEATFNMDESIFHYTSGLLSKTKNPDVEIKLTYGSIGIRGTQIWRDMIDIDGHKTCRIYLEDGQADISNEAGQVTLKHGEGTKIRSLQQSPEAAKPWGEATIQDIKSKTSF